MLMLWALLMLGVGSTLGGTGEGTTLGVSFSVRISVLIF
jgi:hypothetical protein